MARREPPVDAKVVAKKEKDATLAKAQLNKIDLTPSK